MQTVLSLLYIDVNLCTVCDHYFDDVACGQGDIWVYRSGSLSNTYFIVDFHVGMTEQLDISPFYIKTPPGSTYCVIEENGYEQKVVFKN
ncbi:hypothetical protein C5E04_06180 [Pectobacterium parmentieri]|uniref:hypothetical protein n=1 Tax=Pectobacterium parmentieri TaxID=1905730 RepID=UPI000EABABBE|nr:hypothetical protein [Pectobacterium parmentieri]RKO82349.1 hypothetical protein C5E04_06180 [Pectobacterium parmentieri]